jgi:unsaturated chondroitin disaccharide hydrolase
MIHFELPTDRPLFEDAFRFSQEQVRTLIERHPGFYPLYSKDGKWRHEGEAWTHWCDGFLPGMMWIFAKNSKSDVAQFWRRKAEEYTIPLEARKTSRDVYDHGFLYFSTYYRWLEMDKNPALKEVLVTAGSTLAQRFVEKGGYLRSFVEAGSLFIDSMMNVGIIFYAARETGDKRLREIAIRHALTVRKTLVRGDGSTAQEGLFDTDSGEFLEQSTHQGYRRDSCWSRGLAWAAYGFGICYEYSRDMRFLATSEACADYYITHANADGIPPWDFRAPAEQRKLVDTSAAAIMASALIRLSRLIQDPVKGHFYMMTAIRILRTLCEEYLAKATPGWEGILQGSLYHVHRGLGINESAIWGEYFFVEALGRALKPSSR